MGWGDWGDWSDVPCTDLLFESGGVYTDGYGCHVEKTDYSASERILRAYAHVGACSEASYSVAEVALITPPFQVELSGDYIFTTDFERYGYVDPLPYLCGAFTSLTLAEQEPPYNQVNKKLEDYSGSVSGRVTISKSFYLEANKTYVLGFNLSCWVSKGPYPLKFVADFYTYHPSGLKWRIKIHELSMCPE